MRLARLQEPPWDQWLLVRRSIADPQDLAYFVVFGLAGLRLLNLAWAAGRRWLVVEECFEAAKQEVGLADYEVRSWRGCTGTSRWPCWRWPSSPACGRG